MFNDIPLPQPAGHDLSLPAWGPYTKKYNGLAHIPDLSKGIRFDLSVFPGYYRRQVNVPNSLWESGYHPWEAAPGLDYYSYRYDLEWKDQVFCDVAYFALDGEANARGVRVELVNNTDMPQHQVLHYMAYLNFPPVKPYSEEIILPADPDLPAEAAWIDALDYVDLAYAHQRPSDNLVYEGWYRGETRDHGFVNGTGIGCGFGKDAGDKVTYRFTLKKPLQNGLLLARYRARKGSAAFKLSGLTDSWVKFESCQDFSLCPILLGPLGIGQYTMELSSTGEGALELDGFVLLETADQGQVRFTPHAWNPAPAIEPGPAENSLVLNYADVAGSYGLAWTGEPSVVRQFFSSELDRTLRYFVAEHVQKEIHGDNKGHFTNVFIRPVVIEPHSRAILYGLVCFGELSQVRQRLSENDLQSGKMESSYLAAREKRVSLSSNPSGQPYRFSQERMAATLLTNVVYPVYTRRQFIRHFTPGKWWDCLYTWDSGFISLGLMGIDLPRAIDCLNAYTTAPGDTQAAFIHHGSPVFVQIYAFHELWNRTRSQPLLAYFYPRLRQAYLFLAGRSGSSTTHQMRSHLLKTWDYFYNSAGWDDYPPQVYMHAHHMENVTTPVVTTAHMIRSAKLLQLAARALNLDEDIRDYQADIDDWTNALNRFAWDGEAGIYSYVIHDEEGRPVDQLRHESGQNFNLGLDGLSPFFAGACDPAQEQALLERMASEDHFWTPVGLVSVDKAAAYYRADGYWNGSVWFPYQWFTWKALLDLGHGDLAYKIARTALDIWKDEVGATYNCFEHFIVASRRGTGWHHFGGLSSPILAWFSAYHQPGALTCGHETWIEQLQVGPGHRTLQASLRRRETNERPWIALAVMAPGKSYAVDWNGSPVTYLEREEGTLEVQLSGSGILTIKSGV